MLTVFFSNSSEGCYLPLWLQGISRHLKLYYTKTFTVYLDVNISYIPSTPVLQHIRGKTLLLVLQFLKFDIIIFKKCALVNSHIVSF
jgi:hypothetical protein